MSDITATNCGCGCDDRCNDRGGLFNFGNNGDCCSIIWIIILLSICGCGNNGLFGGGRSGSCDNSCIWIILLLFFCGGMGCGC